MRGGELAVDAKLDKLQSGQHLLLTLDNPKASDYLLELNGVKAVKSIESVNDRVKYVLEGDADLASGVASAVLEKGDKLFSIQPEKRNLETVFADVNSGDFQIHSEMHSNKQSQPATA